MSPAPQHLRALERANAVRLARADIKRRIASGEMYVADVVLHASWEVASMTVADLLASQRRWGHTRCKRFLQAAGLSETKTVGTMTERQRNAVAALLGEQRPAAVRDFEPAFALAGA